MSKPSRHAANTLSASKHAEDPDYLARFNRLPQWARAELNMLNQRIDVLEMDLRIAQGNLKGSAVEVDPLNQHLGKPRFFLRDDTRIRFSLKYGWVDVCIKDDHGRGPVLDLNSNFTVGYGRMMLVPEASNDFHVMLVRTDGARKKD